MFPTPQRFGTRNVRSTFSWGLLKTLQLQELHKGNLCQIYHELVIHRTLFKEVTAPAHALYFSTTTLPRKLIKAAHNSATACAKKTVHLQTSQLPRSTLQAKSEGLHMQVMTNGSRKTTLPNVATHRPLTTQNFNCRGSGICLAHRNL